MKKNMEKKISHLSESNEIQKLIFSDIRHITDLEKKAEAIHKKRETYCSNARQALISLAPQKIRQCMDEYTGDRLEEETKPLQWFDRLLSSGKDDNFTLFPPDLNQYGISKEDAIAAFMSLSQKWNGIITVDVQLVGDGIAITFALGDKLKASMRK